MKVGFRVDSSIEIGTGHVMRCLTLANQLKPFNIQSFFICRDLEGSVHSLIQDEGFSVYLLRAKSLGEGDLEWYERKWEIDVEETRLVLEKEKLHLRLVILDHYGLDDRWESVLKTSAPKLLVIDDLANRKHYCDYLLDQNYTSSYQKRYEGLIPDFCQPFLGPEYILLRDEFLNTDFYRKQHTGKIENILVFFGGTDPTGETLKALKALSIFSETVKVNINVIVGSANPRQKEIELYCKCRENMNYYCQVQNISKFMADADLCIGAGGTTTWERCYLGLPSIIIAVADNQIQSTKAVSEKGAIYYLGYYTDVKTDHILNALLELNSDRKKLQKMAEAASILVDRVYVNSKPLATVISEAVQYDNIK